MSKTPRGLAFTESEKKYYLYFWHYTKCAFDDACWLWLGCRSQNYGMFGLYKRGMWKAHIVAYALARGIVPKKTCVLHTCDNPPCVNPAHLFLGTVQDNNRDRHSKGRSKGGDKHGIKNSHVKLSEMQVRVILHLYHFASYSQVALARKFQTTRQNIWRIVNQRTWV